MWFSQDLTASEIQDKTSICNLNLLTLKSGSDHFMMLFLTRQCALETRAQAGKPETRFSIITLKAMGSEGITLLF